MVIFQIEEVVYFNSEVHTLIIQLRKLNQIAFTLHER
jgi:hypothetical protein